MTQSGYANVMNHRNLYFAPGWTRQLASMVLLSLGLGALVGSLSAPPDGGMVGLVAGALAGMIVLPIFGAVFGLLGGRWWETLLGAACGLTTAIVVTFWGGSARIAPIISLYVLLGAFAGATLPQMCRLYLWIARRALSQLRSFRTERTGISSGSTVPEDGAISPYR
jgi:hypothetical protein